ncbi:MAG: VCBS repeat-containing protein, partial [Bacteroidota bacterium]
MGTLIGCAEETPSDQRFVQLDALTSGFSFMNEIREDSVFNVLEFSNIYTGSGVGIGDLNNDGLPEVLMGGCMNSCGLFLNKGNLTFEDITESAGLTTDRWITGISMIDINQDGWLDIYLCVSGPSVSPRENLLYINQGDLTFKEEAEAYGLNEAAQCTQAGFLDYDLDGDLDVMLVVNPTDYTIQNVNTVRRRKLNGEAASTDKFFRNDGNGHFTEVSREAGILIEGYSLGVHTA